MTLMLLYGQYFARHLSFFCVNGIAIFTLMHIFTNRKTLLVFILTLFCFAITEKENIATSLLLNLRSNHMKLALVLFSVVCIQSI